MFDVGNETVAYKTNEEIDEAEADSFLLLDPENTENQTNSELMNSEAVEYLEPVEYDSSTKLQYQDEYSQQQSYSAHKGKNISDIIVPVPSVEAQKIQEEEQHNISFNGEYEASRAAFINTPSSSQSVRFYIPYSTESNFFKVVLMGKFQSSLLFNFHWPF